MPVKEDYNYVHNPHWTDIDINRRYRVGGDTPGYLLAKGIVNENFYIADFERMLSVPIVLKYKTLERYSNNGSLAKQNATFETVQAPTYVDVLGALASNWRNTDFNAGVFVAEGKESVRMIGDTLLQLARAARSIKRLDLRGALSNLSSVPRRHKDSARASLQRRDLIGTWLELRYGWRPLLSDIYALTESIRLEPRTNSVRASATNEELSYRSTGGYFVPYRDKIVANEKRKHVKVRVTGAPSDIERWGLQDPATIIWELVPYSFVIDWVLPIGNFLEALHAVRVMPVTRFVNTDVIWYERKGTVVPGDPHGSYFIVFDGGPYHKSRFTMNRTVSSSMPSELEVINSLPQSIKPFWNGDVLRAADAAALLIQRLRGLRSPR